MKGIGGFVLRYFAMKKAITFCLIGIIILCILGNSACSAQIGTNAIEKGTISEREASYSICRLENIGLVRIDNSYFSSQEVWHEGDRIVVEYSGEIEETSPATIANIIPVEHYEED